MAITNVKAKVDTIAILMLENRSYDHMLSYLSLNIAPNPRSDIDGITSLLKKQYANESATKIYRPWITNDDPLVADLPHGRRLVSVQLRGTETETARSRWTASSRPTGWKAGCRWCRSRRPPWRSRTGRG